MDSDSDNRDGSRKRPQVVRPLPRPSFSASSLNNNATTQSPSSSRDDFASHHPRSRTSSSTQPTGDNPPSSGPRSVSLTGAVITESPVSSPTLLEGQRSFSPIASTSNSRSTLARSRPVKKSSLLSNVSSSAADLVATEGQPSQSKRRWDDLRQHFLPSLAPAQAAQVQPSTTSSTSFDVPQRPSTPKQFRMPKLGFRQVVEQVRESVGDQNRRFVDDIRAALRPARPTEPKAPRREREGTFATMATSLNMGLMGSSANLAMASISTANTSQQSRGRGVRRPPSLQSVATHSQLAGTASLYAVISHHASIAPNQLHVAKILPHEKDVLSALLAPFVGPRSEATDGERLRAMETFEIIVRTWDVASEEVNSFIYVPVRQISMCMWIIGPRTLSLVLQSCVDDSGSEEYQNEGAQCFFHLPILLGRPVQNWIVRHSSDPLSSVVFPTRVVTRRG